MSIQALNWSIQAKTDTPTTKLVLFILSNYSDERGSCYPSEKHLSAIVGVSDRQIRRCLKWLVENNYISIEIRKGTSNRYFLRMDTSDHTSMESNVHTPRTPVSTNTKENTKDIYTDEFEKFWAIYPRKVSKFGSAKSFANARKTASFKKIMVSTVSFAEQNKHTEEKFIPHAQTWLNQKRFEDVININKNSANSLAG